MKWQCALVLLAGCSSSSPSHVPEVHSLTLSMDELELGSPIGVTVTADVIATNENDVATYAIPMLGEYAPDELAIAATDCPALLAPGASCTVTIAFTPKHLGDIGTDAFLEIGN